MVHVASAHAVPPVQNTFSSCHLHNLYFSLNPAQLSPPQGSLLWPLWLRTSLLGVLELLMYSTHPGVITHLPTWFSGWDSLHLQCEIYVCRDHSCVFLCHCNPSTKYNGWPITDEWRNMKGWISHSSNALKWSPRHGGSSEELRAANSDPGFGLERQGYCWGNSHALRAQDALGFIWLTTRSDTMIGDLSRHLETPLWALSGPKP